MRLIRGIPVPGSTLEPGSTTLIAATASGRLQATVTRGAMLTPVTMASLATVYPAESATISLLSMIVKDLVPLEVPDPSRSSKFCANRRVPSRNARVYQDDGGR